ncbi:hypothetical protein ACFE04_017494 [Oxalis oulophora]
MSFYLAGKVFGSHSSTPEVYEVAAKPVVMAAMEDINEIVPEPLGVALVIFAWNFPFGFSGNFLGFAEFRREEDADYPDFSDAARVSTNKAAFLELLNNSLLPIFSEITPATSSLLAKLFGEYLDASLVKVIEGFVAKLQLYSSIVGQNILHMFLHFAHTFLNGGIICKSEI